MDWIGSFPKETTRSFRTGVAGGSIAMETTSSSGADVAGGSVAMETTNSSETDVARRSISIESTSSSGTDVSGGSVPMESTSSSGTDVYGGSVPMESTSSSGTDVSGGSILMEATCNSGPDVSVIPEIIDVTTENYIDEQGIEPLSTATQSAQPEVAAGSITNQELPKDWYGGSIEQANHLQPCVTVESGLAWNQFSPVIRPVFEEEKSLAKSYAVLCVHQSKHTLSALYYLRQCNKPCKALLVCNHNCQGDCSSCHQGRIHKPCGILIERNYSCGHRGLPRTPYTLPFHPLAKPSQCQNRMPVVPQQLLSPLVLPLKSMG